MLLNEFATSGANARQFISVIAEKSTKENHTLLEKFIRNGAEHVLAGLVITTGFEGGTLPRVETASGLLISCQGKCDVGKPYGLAAGVVFLLAVATSVLLFVRETEPRKKDFLLAVGLWFLITFILFTPLAYGMAPRFFLLSGPFFFVLIGCLMLLVSRLMPWKKFGHTVAVTALVISAALNYSSLNLRFDELSRAANEPVDSPPDRILKERIRVTLAQQERIVDFLQARSAEHGYPVYMFSEPQHRRALKYLMERRGIENAVLGYDGIYRQGVYYLVLRAQSDLEDALRKYRAYYTIGSTVPFGTLVAIELIPQQSAIIGERQDFSVSKPSDSLAPRRYTWSEYFSQTDSGLGDDTTSLDQSEDAANNQSE
jgi:hypothetical protein